MILFLVFIVITANIKTNLYNSKDLKNKTENENIKWKTALPPVF